MLVPQMDCIARKTYWRQSWTTIVVICDQANKVTSCFLICSFICYVLPSLSPCLSLVVLTILEAMHNFYNKWQKNDNPCALLTLNISRIFFWNKITCKCYVNMKGKKIPNFLSWRIWFSPDMTPWVSPQFKTNSGGLGHSKLAFLNAPPWSGLRFVPSTHRLSIKKNFCVSLEGSGTVGAGQRLIQ